MATLKEQTQTKHDCIEKLPFSKLLLSGNITKEMYADYLYNMKMHYAAIETMAKDAGLLDDFTEICRTDAIIEDLEQFDTSKCKVHISTAEYLKHLQQLEDKRQLLAHVYVHHFGDMYGGQIIKGLVPSKGKMYEFENRGELIKKVRMVLTEDLGTEANICFDYMIELFGELANEYNLQ